MAKKIRKSISNALHKRKQGQHENEALLDQLINSEHKDDEDLSNKLDAMIEASFHQEQASDHESIAVSESDTADLVEEHAENEVSDELGESEPSELALDHIQENQHEPQSQEINDENAQAQIASELEAQEEEAEEELIPEPMEPEPEPPKYQLNKEDKVIEQEYIKQFNLQLDKNELFIDSEKQKQYHHIAIQKLLNLNASKASNEKAKEHITFICEETKDKEQLMQKLCQNIEKQRKMIVALIIQITALPNSIEKEKLIKFYEVKLTNPYYQPIEIAYNQVLNQGKYVTNDPQFIKSLYLYVKVLVLLTPYEHGLISNYIIQKCDIQNPYATPELEQLNTQIDILLKHFIQQGLESTYRYIHHGIVYNSVLCKSSSRNEFFATISFSTLIEKSLKLLTQEKSIWMLLQQNETFKQSNLQLGDLVQIENDLLSYQTLLNELGKIEIALTINSSDNAAIDKFSEIYPQIKVLTEKVNHFEYLTDLIKMIEVPEINNIKQNLNLLSNMLSMIKNLSKDLDADKYGPRSTFMRRISIGDFFNVNDKDDLVSATFAIHKIVDPMMLIENINKNYKLFTRQKKEHCLFFVRNYLLLDTDNSLISVKFEQSDLIKQIEKFIKLAHRYAKNDALLTSQINEISELLVKKIVDKSNTFSTNMKLIAKGELPPTHLLRRIHAILNEVPKNILNKSIIEEYMIEVNFIIEAPNLFSLEDSNLNEEIIRAIEELSAILQKHLIYSLLANKLLENLNNSLNNISQSKPASDELEVNPKQNYDLLKLVHEVLSESNLILEKEKLIISFVKTIESNFVKYFTQTDLAQLRELSWNKDDKLVETGLMPLAPSIRKYNQYFKLVVYYFSLLILNQVENFQNEITPREKIVETKKIHEFIEKAILRAIDEGAFATAIALNTAINLEPIKRLNLSSSESCAFRDNQINQLLSDQNPGASDVFKQEGLPYLNSILDLIVKNFKRRVNSEFEKRILVGRIFQSFEEKKHNIKEELILYNHDDQMLNLLQNAQLTLAPILKEDIIINSGKVMSVLYNASEHIMPNEFKIYQITDFHTLPGIRDQLTYWHNRLQDYKISGKHPEVQIVDLMKSLLDHDENLDLFNEISQIFSLIEQIETSCGRAYGNYDHDLHEILKIYSSKINNLITDDVHDEIDALDTFFAIFYSVPKIKTICEQNINDLPLFSSQRSLRETIELINKAHEKYRKMLSMGGESKVQQAYSQLLLKVLEGDKQAPVIQIGSSEFAESEHSRSLLPESEFPVPQAEPEHPDYIGINRTMNFNPDSKYKSVLELFSNAELKKDFLHAFPWGLDNHNAKKIESSKYIPGINLIAVDHAIDPHLQLTLMKYILLSLDCLGKLAGNYGELAIVNFNQIKSISDALHEVSTLLEFSELETEVFITKLDHMTYKLILLNTELTDMALMANPPIIVQKGEAMNEFCHINEYLTHKLLGIPYQKSILTPLDPFSKNIESLHPKLKEDLLRHSGIDTQSIAKLSKSAANNINQANIES